MMYFKHMLNQSFTYFQISLRSVGFCNSNLSSEGTRRFFFLNLDLCHSGTSARQELFFFLMQTRFVWLHSALGTQQFCVCVCV